MAKDSKDKRECIKCKNSMSLSLFPRESRLCKKCTHNKCVEKYNKKFIELKSATGRKECTDCNVMKDIHDFNINYSYCKSCLNLRGKKRADYKRENSKVTVKIKKCDTCIQDLPASDFSLDIRKPDLLSPTCKACTKSNWVSLRTYIDEKKRAFPCNCGISDTRILEFAHNDRKEKRKDINGKSVHFGRLGSKKAIDEELPKGRFLCKNCHRIETKNENMKISSSSKCTDSVLRKQIKNLVTKEKINRHKCIDCYIDVEPDGSNSCCFDFDHRIPADKLFSLGNAKYEKNTDIVIKEMQKCDLRCANCHFIKTINNNETGRAGWRENACAKLKEINKRLRPMDTTDSIDAKNAMNLESTEVMNLNYDNIEITSDNMEISDMEKF